MQLHLGKKIALQALRYDIEPQCRSAELQIHDCPLHYLRVLTCRQQWGFFLSISIDYVVNFSVLPVGPVEAV